ncbi:hypothetical protein MKQ70_32420 [Chitinophaga sedimenti]|uniref:hypothetical protein n=1 Tax=Chitinophaga sedimenti TaxID=2033606 RepID=UPI002003BEEC|nr:hypothetical protein [Chitinophaga sedimenti]MCK7559423.1 hypothetical protein [Chitinophaga sedimenti]
MENYTDSILQYLEKAYKYAGFDRTDAAKQLREQVAAGITEPQIIVREQHDHTRMKYTLNTKIGEKAGFYNGMDVVIIKGMPPAFVADGIDLVELELRLATPPRIYNSKTPDPEAFAAAKQRYEDDLRNDLTNLYKIDKNIFYRLAVLYKETFDPLIRPEDRERVDAAIQTFYDSYQIRKQRFPADLNITKVEAYNLMDSVSRPRAVFKTYFVNDNHANLQPAGNAQAEEHAIALASAPFQGETQTSQTKSNWLRFNYPELKEGYNPEKGEKLFDDYGNRYYIKRASSISVKYSVALISPTLKQKIKLKPLPNCWRKATMFRCHTTCPTWGISLFMQILKQKPFISSMIKASTRITTCF